MSATGTSATKMTAREEPARSVTVVFTNQSPSNLVRLSYSGGQWVTFPPEQIPSNPEANVSWETQSDAFMTGTEAQVTYNIIGADGTSIIGTMNLGWDNPYAGDNAYAQELTFAGYTLTRSGGDGDNATVDWVLGVAS
jgi:hypothetical protein